MFGTIFSFEIKRWLKNWVFYLYLVLFFLLGFLSMASAVGVFDVVKVTSSSLMKFNSPYVLANFIEGFNNLLYFLFPSIIGASIYRDFRYEVHHILFSYPFSKREYLAGKFLSSFLVTLLISLTIGIGIFLATLLPWANPNLLGENVLWSYVQVYLLTIIPNMIFFGSIVFVVVTMSRSVYIGFVSMVILLIIQGIIGGLGHDMDNKELVALLDPSGSSALRYYTEYWTVDEINNNNLPIEKWYLLNRGIWLAVSLLFLGGLAKFFTFTQQAFTFSRKSKKSERITKNNFGGIVRIELPKVSYNFSLGTQWSNIFSFAKGEIKYLAKNKVFMILVGLGILMMLLVSSSATSLYGTTVYPITRLMLGIPGSTFQLVIIIITFLGAGLLVHRGKLSRMDLLIDATPTPNYVFFFSKFISLIVVQLFLLLVIMIGGIIVQIHNGYYNFEIGLYLKELIGISWIWYMIWAGLAIAVQTYFRNYLVGFFVLFVFFLFGGQLSKLGIEQRIFFFNKLPGTPYSDMNGFGSNLSRYYIYALYWVMFIISLSGLTLLFWRRGIVNNLKERLYFARKRANKGIVSVIVLFGIGFFSLGGYLYYENTVLNKYTSDKENELLGVEYEKTYKKYENMILPRITDIKVDFDLYPAQGDFLAKGQYVLENKNEKAVDSLYVNYVKRYINVITVDGAKEVLNDTVIGIRLYKLTKPLAHGEKLVFKFEVKNKENTAIRSNSSVLENGTFINNGELFPSFGYISRFELSDDEVRKKYGLKPKERMAEQTDKKALQNTYISSDSDWVTFETTVSTSADQIAIAPGYLQKEWTEGDRRYFHYKMDQKMLNFYAYNSARYEVKRDKWNDINIEIYYHKGHEYNIDRMVNGVKKSLAYYEKEFSPYQHKQVRIIEFPSSMGTFAQSFANTIPFSEAIGFIAKVDEEADNKVDYPFAVTSHEVAHQWWAHQVIGANVQGATMLSESLAEYSSLKVLEAEYGKGQMRKFLKEALDRYLGGRSGESKKEKALMYNENQQYIHYQKGSLVFYTMSDYLGDKQLNDVLKGYIKKVAFQDAPYTTASELVADIKEATPDSLKYLVKDMFETITLYDNYIDKAEVKKLDNGKYEVKIKAIVSKYRADDKGEKSYTDVTTKAGSDLNTRVYKSDKGVEIKSLPLADYIEIGVFAQEDVKDKSKNSKEKVLYLKKVKVSDIMNDFTIIVDEKPTEVGIDPYNKLIDTRSYDNRKGVN
ncbi:hypothetical protein HMPREF9711_02546 [Myroides odoratimimus CCUG 3837]|uniref:M1 family aminopeptidase n=1 Tax=Myroides odoratimimus TaxID=76832 RepID=UPI000280AC22|nr:M1 family aminopeptidase [Myroides odoratimimus]EKB03219.1 hypothetical protein HMPREF9711_02546 [Myroides odoratimimus CCUG 3837]